MIVLRAPDRNTPDIIKYIIIRDHGYYNPRITDICI